MTGGRFGYDKEGPSGTKSGRVTSATVFRLSFPQVCSGNPEKGEASFPFSLRDKVPPLCLPGCRTQTGKGRISEEGMRVGERERRNADLLAQYQRPHGSPFSGFPLKPVPDVCYRGTAGMTGGQTAGMPAPDDSNRGTGGREAWRPGVGYDSSSPTRLEAKLGGAIRSRRCSSFHKLFFGKAVSSARSSVTNRHGFFWT